MADEKDIIVEFLKGKSASKSKFYFKDFTELFPDKGPREVKKILTRLVNEEVLEFWSSGSTPCTASRGPANRPTPRAKIKRLPGGRASRTGNSPHPTQSGPRRTQISYGMPPNTVQEHVLCLTPRMQRLSGEGKGPCPAYRPRRSAATAPPVFPVPLSGGGRAGQGPAPVPPPPACAGQRSCTASHRAERPPYARRENVLMYRAERSLLPMPPLLRPHHIPPA